jgi:CheY-like chemotaxis protein
MKILAIEDNPVDRKVLKKAIESANRGKKFDTEVDLFFASNMHDALEMLAAQEFDVIVSDLRLPDSQGLKTIEAIRAATKKPLIIISGSYLREIMVKALEGGVSRYIMKGESWTTEIASTIKKVIKEDYLVNNIKRLVHAS